MRECPKIVKVNFLLNTFHPPSSGDKHVHSCLPYTKKRFTSRVILVRLADEEYKNLKEIYRPLRPRSSKYNIEGLFIEELPPDELKQVDFGHTTHC